MHTKEMDQQNHKNKELKGPSINLKRFVDWFMYCKDGCSVDRLLDYLYIPWHVLLYSGA
jgi:hypothetical protein